MTSSSGSEWHSDLVDNLSEYVSSQAVGTEEGLPSKVGLKHLHFCLKYTLER